MTQTYVYDGKEVFKTGRTATKTMRNNKTRTLYEIMPAKYINSMPSDEYGLGEWVRDADLFVINTSSEENQREEENDDDEY